MFASLAEEMTQFHKEKKTAIKGSLSWLEGYLCTSIEGLRNKTKVKEYWTAGVGWGDFTIPLEQKSRAIESAKGIDVA